MRFIPLSQYGDIIMGTTIGTMSTAPSTGKYAPGEQKARFVARAVPVAMTGTPTPPTSTPPGGLTMIGVSSDKVTKAAIESTQNPPTVNPRGGSTVPAGVGTCPADSVYMPDGPQGPGCYASLVPPPTGVIDNMPPISKPGGMAQVGLMIGGGLLLAWIFTR